MQDKQHAQLGFVQTFLPWVLAGSALILYVVTLNHWVTLTSLPYAAKVTGWDWTPPPQAPLFFVLSYPIQWLPDAVQPFALNLFAAVCAALTLGLLVRSVSLLPHDRTLAQRQRERSEFSLLSIPAAWLPPAFAALVCGLQLTFWEHATAATNEMLDLLLFAYLIRCLLEYRIDANERWLSKLALVYGMGVTNNWALIGYFPLFVVALIWIKGLDFFNLRFIGRMSCLGLAGLSLYLLLPLVWALSDNATITFWEAFRAQLANQKAFLFNTPALRNRVFVLSLTSLLPLLIMGIRWPSSFGDTSAAGAALTNLMFRVIHIVFLAACLWTFFDQKFSPRMLGFTLPFLSFYYLTALAVGYFAGYVLLVFSEPKTSKTWKRRQPSTRVIDLALTGALGLAAIAIPAGLIYKNFGIVWKNNGPVLREFARATAAKLPAEGVYVLSDDPYPLLLLEGYFSGQSERHKHVFVHTRSLSETDYHRALLKRYPSRWPNVIQDIPATEIVDDATLLQVISNLGSSNRLFYLHPSFGFYFERFYPRPRGLVYELKPHSTNSVLALPGPLQPDEFSLNQTFWTDFKATLDFISDLSKLDSRDAKEVGGYYSRALNTWGVEMQIGKQLDAAAKYFQLASDLNTNNIASLINLEYNKSLRSGQSRTNEISRLLQERFAHGRWESVLVQSGPFDHPDICLRLGQIFADQGLLRQAAAQVQRALTLDPANLDAQVAMADLQIKAGLVDDALARIAELRSLKTPEATNAVRQIEFARLEAAAYYTKTNFASAEQVLLSAEAAYPNQIGVLDGLMVLYSEIKDYPKALKTIDKILTIAPDNVQAAINQATIHFNNQQYADAYAALDRVLKKDSRNLPALLYKIFVAVETKDYKQASADVDRVLQIDPENHEGLLFRAVIDIENKNYSQAIEALDQLIALQPPNKIFLSALRNRAISYLHQGKLSDAQADYEHLQRLVPRYYIAYYGMGEIAYQKKDFDAAIRYYELYLRYLPPKSELAEEKKMVEARLQELKSKRL